MRGLPIRISRHLKRGTHNRVLLIVRVFVESHDWDGQFSLQQKDEPSFIMNSIVRPPPVSSYHIGISELILKDYPEDATRILSAFTLALRTLITILRITKFFTRFLWTFFHITYGRNGNHDKTSTCKRRIKTCYKIASPDNINKKQTYLFTFFLRNILLCTLILYFIYLFDI